MTDGPRGERGFRSRFWGQRRRRLAGVGAAVLLLAAVFYLGGGWYFSGQIEEQALVVEREPFEYPIEVTAVTEDTITLEAVEDLDDDLHLSGGQWDRDLWVGIGTESVSGLVGPAIERTERTATRRYQPPQVGELRVGDRVRMDTRAFWPNPEAALDQPYRAVRYRDDLGEFPAWVIPGEREDVWAIHVHGKGADLTEPMRIEPVVRDAGLTSMVISYRNGIDAPQVPGSIARYGQTEWQDLDAALGWAIDQGAERFLLVGTSMGGSIVLGFLENSDHADRVEGLILDSPATSIGDVIRERARQTALIPRVVNVGPALTWTAMTIAAERFDISWDETDYNARAGELDVPALIWAGEHDETVPIDTIRSFAEAAPDGAVQLEVTSNEQVDHLMSWNADPERYDRVTRDFVESIVPASVGTRAE